jgi:hypothetical protein
MPFATHQRGSRPYRATRAVPHRNLGMQKHGSESQGDAHHAVLLALCQVPACRNASHDIVTRVRDKRPLLMGFRIPFKAGYLHGFVLRALLPEPNPLANGPYGRPSINKEVFGSRKRVRIAGKG